MDCHFTSRFSFVLVCLFAILAVISLSDRALCADTVGGSTNASSSAVMADSKPASAVVRAMRNDAALNDICFITPASGWAVGDRGVIWHTEDGGKTWSQQTSNTECNLQSVEFIDARRGWAVGGECLEGRVATRGTVLRTDDGGATWTPLTHHTLPSLAGAKFFDRDHGIAFGQSASYAPSAVFTTHDGGNSWQPMISDQNETWFAGDFLAPDAGAFAGPAGRLATLQRQKIVHSPLAASALRSFRAMRLVAPTSGWAVGDGGLLMTTHDLGRSWQTPPTELPRGTADQFDFRAIATQGSQVWIAGSPGTVVFHSSDNGQTWQTISTGQSIPIHSLTFVDANHGWAAGDLGNILATEDGGRTWKPQRSGGSRAALLTLFTDTTDVPLELLADSGAADGYIAAVDSLCAPVDNSSAEAIQNAAPRKQEALLRAGAAATTNTWRFPLPKADLALSPADLLQALNRENDGRALEQLRRHVVLELRMWRPDVVVTYHAASSNDSSLNALIEQLVLDAVKSAAAPSPSGDAANDAALPAWQVKKVYGVLAGSDRGEELIASGRFSPYLGAALSDYTSSARRLLSSADKTSPETYELKLLLSNVPEAGNTRGIFGGIVLAPGSEARRPQIELPTQDLEVLRENATRRRHLQELMERTEGNAAWTAQVSSMLEGLDPDDAAQLLVQLGDGYRKTGRLDLAADTYFLLARRYPDHSLVEPSLEWLVHFYASSEMAHRLQTHSAATNRLGMAVSNSPSDGVRQASAATPIAPAVSATGGLSREDRLHRAVQLVDYLKTTHPAMYAEQSIRFAEVAAQRQLGFANPAERYFLTLRQLPESNAWRECAATEEWLAHPADAPPVKKLATCRVMSQPPKLDGKLDEPSWAHADHLRLTGITSPAKVLSTDEVQLTHDSQFLYVAIHCRKVASVDYSTDDSPRTHDADLTQRDRVTLRLDIDRDYDSAFELTVDSRGWTCDACCADATWNPSWYVAASSDDTAWTIEAAIPLAQLVEKSPEPREVWAVSAQRTIPRVGYQTWAGQPTSANTPDEYGMLIFE